VFILTAAQRRHPRFLRINLLQEISLRLVLIPWSPPFFSPQDCPVSPGILL
jgi:hypothetical protein